MSQRAPATNVDESTGGCESTSNSAGTLAHGSQDRTVSQLQHLVLDEISAGEHVAIVLPNDGSAPADSLTHCLIPHRGKKRMLSTPGYPTWYW